MSIVKQFVGTLLGFFVGVVAVLIIPSVFAHEGHTDANLIHGCVSKLTNRLAIVDVGSDCGKLETPIHFPATLTQLPPFVCSNCNLQGITALKNKDLTGAWLNGTDMPGADFEGTVFKDVKFVGVAGNEANFKEANMEGASFYNSSLTGAIGMTTAILTGVTWSNTTCPDGTNSDDHDNTCLGHLTP